MIKEQIPIRAYIPQEEHASGCDSRVFFDGDDVNKKYFPFIDRPDVVWDYAKFMHKAGQKGVLASGTVPIFRGEPDWKVEIRCVPVRRVWLEDAPEGLVPVTQSPRIAGLTSMQFLHGHIIKLGETYEDELSHLGVSRSEIARINRLLAYNRKFPQALGPLSDVISKGLDEVFEKLDVYGLSVLSTNDKIRSENARTLTYWITDFGISIDDLVYRM